MADTITQTNIAQPWGPQQPYIEDALQEMQNLYYSGGPDWYPGDTIAPMSAVTQQGHQATLNYAQDVAPGLWQAGTDALGVVMNPNMMYAESNPYLQSAIQAAQTPVTQQYEQSVIPSISSAAQAAGAYGGSRHGTALANASDAYMRNIGDISSNMAYQNYNDAQRMMLTGVGLSPGQMAAGALPGDLITNVGHEYDLHNQAIYDKDFEEWMWEANRPYEELAYYMEGVSTPGLGGSSVSTMDDVNAMTSNPWTSALGGAIAGFGATGNWWGAGLGAALGWLGSEG